MSPPVLPPPARYFPASKGRYDVSPALKPLGTDYGNGEADRQAFQLDWRFPEYRENKLRCRAEAPERHIGEAEYTPEVAEAVARWMVEQLTEEHPGCFRREETYGGTRLHCHLTAETLCFDPRMQLLEAGEGGHIGPSLQPLTTPPLTTLDRLCRQVQEDVAVVSTDGARDWLSAYHVCAPSHWRPETKRGLPFASVHAPVPGMEPVNRVAGTMVEMMVRRGPWVRFVWGVDTHRGLNRHPEPPPGVPPDEWRGPDLDPGAPSPFVLRVERQVIWGLPEVGAAVFLIRPSHVEAADLSMEERGQLRAALLTMSPESRAYKGLTRHWNALLAWLQAA